MRALFVLLVAAASAAALFAAAAAFAAPFDWRADALANFRPHLAAAAAALAALALAARAPGVATVGLVAALAAALPCAQTVLAAPPAAPGADSLRVVSFNVHGQVADAGRIAAWLSAQDADVVVLLEVGRKTWQEPLSGLRGKFPFQAASFGVGRGDVAVLSRSPLVSVSVRNVDDQPVVAASIVRGQRALRVVAAHPCHPLSEREWRRRNELFAAMAERGGLSEPFARGGSYPSRAKGFGLPIDHVMAGGGASVRAESVGPDVGSHHLPVVATVNF